MSINNLSRDVLYFWFNVEECEYQRQFRLLALRQLKQDEAKIWRNKMKILQVYAL